MIYRCREGRLTQLSVGVRVHKDDAVGNHSHLKRAALLRPGVNSMRAQLVDANQLATLSKSGACATTALRPRRLAE